MNASSGERGMGIRSGPTKQGWEQSEFPILCETCLGGNPFVRMTKSQFGSECKVCTRPFTVFRWKPGSNARYKKTEICQTCSKAKNVCQTCIFDLHFGLPVELRDKFIDKKQLVQMPKDEANRDYWANNMTASVDKRDLPYKNPEVLEALQKVKERHVGVGQQQKGVQHRRNLAHVCSFFVQGKCNRGSACPYRHDNITEEDLKSMQKGQGRLEDRIKDRFNGVNDPLAKKIIDKIDDFKVPKPPSDVSITTLFIGGVGAETTKESIKEKFEPFGVIQAIRLIPSKQCAFVSFKERISAEKAFEAMYERLYLNDSLKKLKLLWAKSQLDHSQITKKKRDQKQLTKQKNENENVDKQDNKQEDEQINSKKNELKRQKTSEEEQPKKD